MSGERKELPLGLRRAVDQFKYDKTMEDLEVLRCSSCLEPLDKPEPIYELRVPSPDPDGESEVTEHYLPQMREARSEPKTASYPLTTLGEAVEVGWMTFQLVRLQEVGNQLRRAPPDHRNP